MTAKPLPLPLTFSQLQGRATISLPEAASILGVSRPHIYAMAKRGDLPLVNLGARKLVSAQLLVQRLTTSELASEDHTA